MAILQPYVLIADRIPALVSQVIELCNEYPPIRPDDLSHACFPGYMLGTAPGMGAWKERYAELLRDVDARMQVLHAANLIWRRELKQAGTNKRNPYYYRHNNGRQVVPISEEVFHLPFHEIKPLEDERFPKVF